jgi:hypothetical protein
MRVGKEKNYENDRRTYYVKVLVVGEKGQGANVVCVATSKVACGVGYCASGVSCNYRGIFWDCSSRLDSNGSPATLELGTNNRHCAIMCK